MLKRLTPCIRSWDQLELWWLYHGEDVRPAVVMVAVVLVLLWLLAGCAIFSPSTDVAVTYDDGTGKMVRATYSSTKDVMAPSFSLQRDADGRVSNITLSAEGSLSSPVIMQNAALIGVIVQGAIQGALGALNPVPGGAGFSAWLQEQPSVRTMPASFEGNTR